MKNKLVSAAVAAAMVKDGMTLMVGGFTFFGHPHKITDALVAAGVKNLTLIANDNAAPHYGTGKMVVNHQFKKIISTHIGRNPETGRQMNAGETEVILIPQGTMAERIRCGGAGLGGFFTPTGVGTEVETGKEKRVIDGKEYILEAPLRADIALIKANVADKKGNLFIRCTAKNLNPIMATAADLVIAQADKVVEVGELDPELVTVPGILVDYIVAGDE
jgi:acetate CoA/acetoacetate CoA-transferase alpha subunit